MAEYRIYASINTHKPNTFETEITGCWAWTTYLWTSPLLRLMHTVEGGSVTQLRACMRIQLDDERRSVRAHTRNWHIWTRDGARKMRVACCAWCLATALGFLRHAYEMTLFWELSFVLRVVSVFDVEHPRYSSTALNHFSGVEIRKSQEYL